MFHSPPKGTFLGVEILTHFKSSSLFVVRMFFKKTGVENHNCRGRGKRTPPANTNDSGSCSYELGVKPRFCDKRVIDQCA